MSPIDAEKSKQRKRRYLERKKVEKYGPDAAGKNMRGKHGNHASGKDCGRWNDGRMLSSHGYVKIRVGRKHPLSDPNGYAYEHLIVWLAAGRAMPTDAELIHHKNEDKTDNRLENLELKTRSDHGRLHMDFRQRDSAGRLLDGREWNEFPAVNVS